MLSLERGFGSNTVLSVNYVGTQGHRLLVLEEANPGNPALCLFLSNPANLAPGQTPCGPFGEDTQYITSQRARFITAPEARSARTLAATRIRRPSATPITTLCKSRCATPARRLTVLAGYTFSKSQDQSSNLGEEVNPLNPALSKALSAFDVKHNFVVSYSYQLPFENLFRAIERAGREGWELSGITHFSSGLPVTLVNFGDNSLLGSEPNGINNFGVDEPDDTGAALNLNSNPRNGQAYFNTAAFTRTSWARPAPPSAASSTVPEWTTSTWRCSRTCASPNRNLSSSGIEAFNVFNHAQFFGPQAVDGNISSSTFGKVIGATAPRLVQLGFKFLF